MFEAEVDPEVASSIEKDAKSVVLQAVKDHVSDTGRKRQVKDIITDEEVMARLKKKRREEAMVDHSQESQLTQDGSQEEGTQWVDGGLGLLKGDGKAGESPKVENHLQKRSLNTSLPPQVQGGKPPKRTKEAQPEATNLSQRAAQLSASGLQSPAGSPQAFGPPQEPQVSSQKRAASPKRGSQDDGEKKSKAMKLAEEGMANCGNSKKEWERFTTALVKSPDMAAQASTKDEKRQMFNEWIKAGQDIAALRIRYRKISEKKDRRKVVICHVKLNGPGGLVERYGAKKAAHIVKKRTDSGNFKIDEDFPADVQERSYPIVTERSATAELENRESLELEGSADISNNEEMLKALDDGDLMITILYK